MLHCGHVSVGWLDFITGKLAFAAILIYNVNGDDYRGEG
jgi:hypothetical protein